MDIPRLKKQLTRQLRFLERSSAMFDAGYCDEAIRIATTIRVMIYQTPQSTSLLTLLGERDTIKLVSTVKFPPEDKGTLAIFDGVTTMTIDGFKPNLNSPYSQLLTVEEWWNQVVIVFGPQNRLTRKAIVLAAANKDGGAHVDPSISTEYQDLIDGLWTLTRQDAVGTQRRPMTDHQFIALRQFAHELLNSS